MNCISCGNPNIKFEFVADSERNFLCHRVSCYFQFLEIYQSLHGKNGENMFSSIEETLNYLTPLNFSKFVKDFGYFEIFSEEIYDQNPKNYFKKDKILEFYMKYLNSINKFPEKMLIGPITAKTILEKPKDFSLIVTKRIIEQNKKFFERKLSDIKEIFIIFRDSDEKLKILNISKDNEEKKMEENGNIIKDEIYSNLAKIFISDGIAKKDLSNLVFEPKEQVFGADLKNEGYDFCLKAEEFLKFDNGVMKSEKELMVKINELISLG